MSQSAERTATRSLMRELSTIEISNSGNKKKRIKSTSNKQFKRRFVERRYCFLVQRQLEVLPWLIPIVPESRGSQERRG
jgi:phosphopantetheinyl transferase